MEIPTWGLIPAAIMIGLAFVLDLASLTWAIQTFMKGKGPSGFWAVSVIFYMLGLIWLAQWVPHTLFIFLGLAVFSTACNLAPIHLARLLGRIKTDEDSDEQLS